MSRSAGGAYTVPPGTDATTATSISSSAYNTLLDDLESEITDSWSRSGKGAALADMAMGSHKFTGLAAGTVNGDSVRYEQIAALQPLDATLTALAAFNTVGILVETAPDTFAGRSIAVSGTGLSVTNPAGTAGNPTVTIDPAAVVVAGGGTPPTAASQADQEAASSTTTFVSPGRQQFHPATSKCWGYVTISGGVPSLQTPSYNVTSITDSGVGRLTITIGTDFSSANYCVVATTTTDFGSNQYVAGVQPSQAAGSVEIDAGAQTIGRADPAAYHFVMYGDQ